MIKILGTFKVVPDLVLLSEEDWTATDENLVDTDFIKTVWNCFDESALEMMLKLSDQSEGFGIDFHLGAVTIGTPLCDSYLKTLYALGFDQADRIECEEEMTFWPELTARLMVEYMSHIGSQDVIIMGRQSADGDNGKTPLLTAELLGWPCITQVVKIMPNNDNCFIVTHLTDSGTEQLEVNFPCVLSVGDAPSAYLRVPTLKDRMKRGKHPVEVLNAAQLLSGADRVSIDPSATLLTLEPLNQKREGKVIEGSTIGDKVQELYQSYLKGRLDKC